MSAPAHENNHALLEIGTEELPPGFLAGLPACLTELTTKLLADARLSAGNITVWTTPRRIALLLADMPATQPDDTVAHKGPPVRIAFDADGKPTKPAEAFAKKVGVSVSKLATDDSGKEPTLTYTEEVTGQPTQQVLGEVFAAIINGLQGPRFMRWGEYDLRFPRPIHWLVGLWNESPLEFSVGHLRAGTQTRGHRLYAPIPIAIPSVSAYEATLRDEGHVVVNPAKRRTIILEALAEQEKKHQGQLIQNDALLSEVVSITEWPWVFAGKFSADYLTLPKAVITTVMASHQRYFALENNAGDLLPVFLGASNGDPAAVDNIVVGNQKVLKARLNDAQFFLEADMNTPLTERNEQLCGMTFQKGLGTMAQKGERLLALVPTIAQDLGIAKGDIGLVEVAAKVAKADLTTHMVTEFTELEGHIGQAYATRQGLPTAVAVAIREHYQPRFQGDELPQTPAGTVVSLADKIDTLVCVLAQPNVKMPTGSSDPLGLRRLVNGVLLMLMEDGRPVISVEQWCNVAYAQAPLAEKADWQTVWAERLVPFVVQRLRSLWQETALPHDVQDALLADTLPGVPHVLERLATLPAHAESLAAMATDSEQYTALVVPATRMKKILGTHYNASAAVRDINDALLVETAEKNVYNALTKAVAGMEPSWGLLTGAQQTAVAAMAPAVDAFFEDVMVNADDAKVKENRQLLLSVALQAYSRLGDITQLQEPAVPAHTTPGAKLAASSV